MRKKKEGEKYWEGERYCEGEEGREKLRMRWG